MKKNVWNASISILNQAFELKFILIKPFSITTVHKITSKRELKT